MIPTVKPVSRDEFPFRRMLRNERPARALFTTLAGHTNENDLAALQSRNSLLSVEDITVLTMAQEEVQFLPYATVPDQIYQTLPGTDDQISFDFIEKKQAALDIPTQPAGALLNAEY